MVILRRDFDNNTHVVMGQFNNCTIYIREGYCCQITMFSCNGLLSSTR